MEKDVYSADGDFGEFDREFDRTSTHDLKWRKAGGGCISIPSCP